MSPNRERVWVGLFVVVAIAILAGTAVAVWGGFGRSGVPHRVYFKFSGGMQPGAPVRYGGMRVGMVTGLRIDPKDSTRIEVDLVVVPGTPIKMDSVAKLASLGPLSDGYIEISTGTQSAALVPPGSVLNSAESMGFAQLGDVIQNLVPEIHEVLDKVTLNLDMLQTTLTRANDLLNDNNRSNIAEALARTNDLLSDRNRANLSESLSNMNQMLNESRPKVSATLTNINDATARLSPLLEDVKRATARADQMLSTLDSLLAENRPDLKASTSELRKALEDSTMVMDQLQGMLNQNSANIYDILENLRFSTANIRTLTETIKSSPASLIRGVNISDRKPGEMPK
jgi:phospholipid/cholesterol/gamma-HCH transport system substrate-binding protein